MKDNLSNIGFVSIAFFASLFCVGAFHEYISCILSVFLSVWLLINHLRRKKTFIYLNITTLCVALIVLFYGLSALWAVDSGMAFVGFLKMLPLLLFTLALTQTDEKQTIIGLLPYAVAIMAVLSAVLAQIPLLSDYFVVAGRLSGFLQYPNTFAILILISELMLLTKEKIKYYDIVSIALLVAALIYTGSRSVFIIAIIANVTAIIFTKSKRFIFYSVLALLAGGFVAIVFLIATENTHIIERLFHITFKESTFIGRFLYYSDVLPVILKNPFGLGYMGYYYMQPSFQSGIYSTAYVHNDLLQLMVDIGWIPSLLFAFVLLKKIFGKKTKRADRIILSSLVLHSLFDFNMQFLSLFFVYLLLLDLKEGKEYVLQGKIWAVSVLSAILSCVSLYMGTSLLLYRTGNYDMSYTMYPFNPNTETALLVSSNDIEQSNAIATKMQKRNEYVLLAYSVKARYAYTNGDYEDLIKIKNETFEIAPFIYEEYEEYARMLIDIITLCKQSGDEQGAQTCISELKTIPEKLDNLKNRVSTLGKLINDQPQTQLPDVLLDYIESME